MNYNFAEIVARVRIALDENQIENAIIENDDTLELDDIIGQKILMAARQLLLTAPIVLISHDCTNRLSEGWSRKTIFGRPAWVALLPDDWLRLASAKVSDWQRAVSIAVGEDSVAAQVVSSTFDGVAPSHIRPLAVIGDSDKGLELRLHGGGNSGTDSDSVLVNYVPIPEINDGVIRLPERLLDKIIYLAAAMTASTIEDNRAGILYQLAQIGDNEGVERESKVGEYYNRDGRLKRR